jgi:hypothetical protein
MAVDKIWGNRGEEFWGRGGRMEMELDLVYTGDGVMWVLLKEAVMREGGTSVDNDFQI